MKMAAMWFGVLAIAAATGCADNQTAPPETLEKSRAAPVGVLPETRPLFTIERSKNANVVHYDARLNSAGELDSEEPVIAYYIMLAEDGRRKELNWIEKRLAYGFDIAPDPSAGGYKMTMVAVPESPISVKKVGSSVRAELVIDGKPAVLEKMYIDATEGLTGPTVNYIKVYGKDLKTGKKLFEKVVRD